MNSSPPSAVPSPTPAPRRRGRRIATTLLIVLLALVALAWAFDWTWCRPAIQHYVMSHSGRRFDFDRMRVRFTDPRGPTVEFDNLRVQNAPWADTRRPLIAAGRVSASFSWRTLFSSETIVNEVMLEDAQVDMERQADGLRNWRLGHPDDRGPPTIKIAALDVRRSQLHTVHGGLKLVADAQVSPLPQPRTLAGHPDLPLTKHLVFNGTYDGKPFSGDAEVSDVLAFGISAQRFAERGSGHLGGWRLDAAGTSTDMHAIADIDVDVTLATDGSGDLWPLPPAIGRARPITVQGHLTKTATTWTATGVHARLGQHSEFTGEGGFVDQHTDGARRQLRATLHDVLLDVEDIRSARGQEKGKPAAASSSASATAGTTAAKDSHALSSTKFDLAKLRDIDADVDLKGARFLHAERDVPQSLRGHVTLKNGLLQLEAFDFGLAEGHLTGTARIDASREPADLALNLQARRLRLDRLSEKFAANGGLIGAVDGHVDLRSQGDSLRALAAAANGRLTASLAPGATVSKRLDAKLSLDGGEWLRSVFDRSERVPVSCAALALDIQRGIGVSRGFQFETEHTALAGGGSVSFADETIEGAVMPVHKTHALLALDKSVRFSGPWREIKVSLGPALKEAAPARCGAPATASAR